MGDSGSTFYLIGSIIGGVGIGGFCGMIPLLVGFTRKRKLLGFLGFFISIAFGITMILAFQKPAFLSFFPSATIAGLIYLLTCKDKTK